MSNRLASVSDEHHYDIDVSVRAARLDQLVQYVIRAGLMGQRPAAGAMPRNAGSDHDVRLLQSVLRDAVPCKHAKIEALGAEIRRLRHERRGLPHKHRNAEDVRRLAEDIERASAELKEWFKLLALGRPRQSQERTDSISTAQ